MVSSWVIFHVDGGGDFCSSLYVIVDVGVVVDSGPVLLDGGGAMSQLL